MQWEGWSGLKVTPKDLAKALLYRLRHFRYGVRA